MSDVEIRVESLAQLREELGDALELAIAAGAPLALLEKLGAASGLLNALARVPQHTLISTVVDRARKAQRAWRQWQERRPRTIAA
jgi:hypothetical protein